MSRQIIPERIEIIHLLIEVKASAYEQHKEALDILFPEYQDKVIKQPDDTIKINYKFRADYYGVVQRLQAVQELCGDPDVVVAADCDTLEANRILIYETLKKLDNIIQHVKGQE